MAVVKDFNKNEAKVPENPCALPIALDKDEIGLTIVNLTQIAPTDQIFITAKAGMTKNAGIFKAELTFRIRRGGVDGLEVYRRVRNVSDLGTPVLTTFTLIESGISGPSQYTLTVQMTKGAPGEVSITDLVSMSGVVYGN